MAKYNLLLPRMGESVSEATIVKWTKEVGDSIEIDETILEIATDKVDSDIPSPVAGKLVEQLFQNDEIAQVGDVIAILEVEGEIGSAPATEESTQGIEYEADNQYSIKEELFDTPISETASIPGLEMVSEDQVISNDQSSEDEPVKNERFFSPLVKSIALEEGISIDELQNVKGSGLEGRVTKQDIIKYISERSKGETKAQVEPKEEKKVDAGTPALSHALESTKSGTFTDSGDEIIEMDRMRRLISDHMLNSVKTSAHVSSFVEADVTNVVNWRNKNKDVFLKREGTKITFTPIFIEAIAKAIRDFPMINISVNGTQIIKKKNINIGMAAALPNGNLIVPVIKNADQLNLAGISKSVNDLAQRARANKLKPDEVQDGTFTLTNIGSFGNIMGTPIINQPQVAILAVGSIIKKPAVIETEYGDMIGIRHKMYLSLSYDHRVVDGALGGMFLRRIADYLEEWDINRIV
ncbi:MAG TPA: dihydrolipoamide acetyltransferase family protein [Sphingobacteriaceae bacterium]|nr:dihydrolipoamide acetyltransferase family protein [Sphingobacteriaceae bacterium]